MPFDRNDRFGRNNRNDNPGQGNRFDRGGDRPNRGGGFDRDNRGGFNRDNRGGGFDRDNRGGGFNRDARGGGFDRDNRQGGNEQRYDRQDRPYDADRRFESVFSNKLRAGKRRTYFFDVQKTKSNDYYLTITESTKRPDESYSRHKIFIYKEDFNKFLESLTDTIEHVKTELLPEYDFDEFARRYDGDEEGGERDFFDSRKAAVEKPAPKGFSSALKGEDDDAEDEFADDFSDDGDDYDDEESDDADFVPKKPVAADVEADEVEEDDDDDDVEDEDDDEDDDDDEDEDDDDEEDDAPNKNKAIEENDEDGDMKW